MLTENLMSVEKRIEEACKRANRAREEVTLIAVSKTKPIEKYLGDDYFWIRRTSCSWL